MIDERFIGILEKALLRGSSASLGSKVKAPKPTKAQIDEHVNNPKGEAHGTVRLKESDPNGDVHDRQYLRGARAHIASSPYATTHQLHDYEKIKPSEMAFEDLEGAHHYHEAGKYGHEMHSAYDDHDNLHISTWSTPESRAREKHQIDSKEEYAIRAAHGHDKLGQLEHASPEMGHVEINRALKHVGLPERTKLKDGK